MKILVDREEIAAVLDAVCQAHIMSYEDMVYEARGLLADILNKSDAKDIKDNPVTFDEWLANHPDLPYLHPDIAKDIITREYDNKQAILELLDMIITVSDPSHEAVTTIPVIERAVSLNTSAVNLKAKMVGEK